MSSLNGSGVVKVLQAPQPVSNKEPSAGSGVHTFLAEVVTSATKTDNFEILVWGTNIAAMKSVLVVGRYVAINYTLGTQRLGSGTVPQLRLTNAFPLPQGDTTTPVTPPTSSPADLASAAQSPAQAAQQPHGATPPRAAVSTAAAHTNNVGNAASSTTEAGTLSSPPRPPAVNGAAKRSKKRRIVKE